MAKLFVVVLVVAVIAVASAVPARLNNVRKTRFFARQELPAEEVASQTPYPPSGIRPDTPFDLPNEQQLPEEPEEPAASLEPEEPQQPDNTYLPPDNLLPPAEAYGPPDQFYGPPETEEPSDDEQVQLQDDQNELVAVEPEAEEVENPQTGRLVLAKRLRKQSVRPAKLRAAKLRALPAATRVRSQRLVAQPVYSKSGALVAYKVLRV